VLLGLLASAHPAAAQGELAVIDFQDEPPFVVTAGDARRPLQVLNKPGPKGPGVLWNFSHFKTGGWNDRAFVRYSWWDWNVSKTGHGSDQAGWTGAGAWFRPASGWPGAGPYYLRFRIRINAPLLPQSSNGQCDGDTQMKFFIWNSFTGVGLDRVIMMLHAGSEGGGDDKTRTTLDLRAGVSGSHARASLPNHEWVHVQLAWQWGPERTGFQRIYVNNNVVAKPTAENRRFDDLNAGGANKTWGGAAGPTGLDNQFFIGDITNTGSCVRADAEIDLMDVELATAFDSAWHPGR
jgi:hypothetical protein